MKAHFICVPRPEESSYSLAGRTRTAMGVPSAREFLRWMIGSPRTAFCAAICIPGFIHQTLLHFLTCFIGSPEKRAAIKYAAVSGDHAKTNYLLGRMRARRLDIPFMRYCPACAGEQKRAYSEAYWTRLPQVAGIDYCPDHGVRFLDSGISRRYPGDLHRLSPLVDSNPDLQLPVNQYQESALSISRSAERLLDLEPGWDSSHLNRSWRGLLHDGGLDPYRRGALKHLANGLRDKFGEKYLGSSGCSLGPTLEYSWAARFLRNPAAESDPLRHLLVLEWCGRSLDDLIEGPSMPLASEGIDRKTMTCINNVCPDMGMQSPGQTLRYHDKYTRRTVNQFTCSTCGQISVCQAKESSTAPRIVSRGHLWESELVRLWHISSLSLREVGRRLSAESLTVKRHALAIGLPFPRKAVRLARVIPVKLTSAKRDSTHERQSRRRSWQIAITTAKGTWAARQMVPADYAWLRRHDRAWLDGNLPARSNVPNSCVRRVDWAARECLYLAKLGDAYLSIVSRRPFQICSTMALAKEVGADRTLKFLDKMPRLNREMGKLVEDTQRFALRRLTAVHQTSSNWMTASQLRKAAGVRSSITKIPTVKKHIDFLLQKNPRT